MCKINIFAAVCIGIISVAGNNEHAQLACVFHWLYNLLKNRSFLRLHLKTYEFVMVSSFDAKQIWRFV